MFPLSIKDIREWMIENRIGYKRLEKEEFSNPGSPMRWLYTGFKDLLECYSCVPDCDTALSEIHDVIKTDHDRLIHWVRKYEYLGAKKLLLFEVLYMDWADDLSEEHLKVQKDIYIERAPFNNLICFCNIFSLLYWESEIHLAQKGSIDRFLVFRVKDMLNKAALKNY